MRRGGSPFGRAFSECGDTSVTESMGKESEIILGQQMIRGGIERV